MKTVTDDFVDAQRQNDAKGVRQLQYKKRRWVQSSRTYEWDDIWSDLDDAYILNISPINSQLDNDILNEFKISNVTLTLNNDFGYFNFDNPDGFFAQDTASPNHMYQPYWTKFRIRSGFLLIEEGSQVVPMFVGLAEEYVFESEQKTVQLTLQGLESILTNTKAEEFATAVSAENAGTGDASTVDFTTLNPGVGEVTEVSVAGLKVIEGVDYSVSQLNEPSLGAKITFTNPPDIGEVVRITYSYWPQGYQFHELVEALLTAAGIDTANQQVQTVSFGNSVINNVPFTSQSDWQSGTLSKIDTTRAPGSIYFDVSQYSQNATLWEESLSGWTASGITGRWTSDGTKLTGHGSTSEFAQANLSRASTHVIGTWSFKFQFNSTGSLSFTFGFMSSAIGLPGNNVRVVGGPGTNFFINGTGTTWSQDTAQHTVIVTRDSSGTMKAYLDGDLKITLVDNTMTTSSYLVFANGLSGPSDTVSIDNIVIPSDSDTATWESPVMDMGSTPTSFFSMETSKSAGAGTILIQTKTSTDGMSFDAYTAVDASEVPQSALKRYAKIKITFTVSSTSNSDPFFNSLNFRWETSSVTVTLPAFTGKSIYESIQTIGEFTNYEFGFDAEENFFFRQKVAGDSVMDLSENDYVSNITGMDSGYARVYGTVRATYGDIVREVTDDGQFPESPNARVLNRRFEISPDTSIQVPASADMATGIASSLFAYFSKPRKRFKMITKFLPQLDLSDAVSVRLINNNAPKAWCLGDDVDLGDEGLILWGEKNQLAFGTLAKIIGARHDTERYTSEFDLEEVV